MAVIFDLRSTVLEINRERPGELETDPQVEFPYRFQPNSHEDRTCMQANVIGTKIQLETELFWGSLTHSVSHFLISIQHKRKTPPRVDSTYPRVSH